ncbi:MAG TPA: DHA2 family efflux MFS transporter permease subunit [Candidatus Nanoarchaeia archaeon]|nr:DHA2 family efflux MFS transporter permease subunit [Candidatus Nanoarchaeia archaeon]
MAEEIRNKMEVDDADEIEVEAEKKGEVEFNPALRWMILLTVIIGTFLGRLDQTIVNLALPKIINDFGITVTAAGWIGTAYILANAVFVPIWGKLGDTVGRKKIYLIGFSLFILGSVLAGLSWNLSSLIAFRIIQAIAGSADYPTAMAIIAVTFPQKKERAQALGIWSASFGVAAVFGPLIGGPLIDNFGWRSVFLINLPVGIVGALMAWLFVHESKSGAGFKNFDWWGALSLGAALTALVLVLDQGSTWGWFSVNSFIAYFSTLLFGIIFVWLEHTAVDPIVDLKFFQQRVFVGALINNFVIFMGMMGSLFLIPVFAQTFMGYTATQSGFLFMPMVAGMMLASPLGGSLTGKVDSRLVIFLSTIVSAIGFFIFTGIDVRSGPLDIIWPMFIMAFGMGFGMAPRTAVITNSVPPSEVGVASSVLALGRNIAGAFGIAVFSTILTNATNSKVLSIAQNSILHSLNPADFQKFAALIMLDAQISAYRVVFLVSAVIVLLGSFTSFLLKRDTTAPKEKVFIE